MGRRDASLLAFATTVILLLAVLLAHHRMRLREESQTRSVVLEQAREPAARLVTLLYSQLQGLRIFAESATESGRLAAALQLFQALAPRFHRYFEGFQAINWIDTTGVIRLVYPEQANRTLLNQNLRQHPDPQVTNAFLQALGERQPTSTPLVELIQGGQGFFLYVPVVRADDIPQGCLAAVFRLDSLMAAVVSLDTARQFNIELYDGDRLAYRSLADRTGLVDYGHLDARLPIVLLNQTWTLRLTPSADIVERLRNPMTQRLAWSGVFFALASGVVIFLLIRRRQERQLLLRELRLSEARYRRLVENAPLAIFTLSPEGRVVSMNQHGQILLRHALLAERPPFVDLVDASDREAVSEALSTALGGHTATFDFKVSAADGSQRRFRGRFVPSEDTLGKVTQVTGVADDITESKEAEEALRESEERYRGLVELSPEAIAVHCEGKLVYLNTAGVRLLGAKSAEELLGTSVLDYVHPDDRERVVERIRRSYEDREPVEPLEERFIRVDGQVIEVEVASVPIRFGGKPATQVLVRDVTESKRLERQLRQAQKLEAVGRLAGGIAHDFNNILTGITGYCNLIQLSLEADHPSRHDVEEVIKAADRAATLTRQLLAFSRRQILEPRVLNLNDVVRGMEPMLRRLIGEDIEMTLFYGESLGHIRADIGQIQQVIINLAVNARDAMPKGGRLTIETTNVALDEAYAERHVEVRPGQYVLLAVTDTGEGIAPEVRDHIFEPFFTTKESGGGTGLGLSTVYGIVKQSGGHIWVYSEPESGTTFKVYLPRVDAPADRIPAEEVKVIPKGNETVLLVEDDDAVRDSAVRFLAQIGYRVLMASSATEALELVSTEKAKIDLVVTDVVMPQMNGRELVERLRRRHPHLRTIYMSGYTENVIVHHGVLEEGVAFLQKPFDPATLARKIRQVLDESIRS